MYAELHGKMPDSGQEQWYDTQEYQSMRTVHDYSSKQSQQPPRIDTVLVKDGHQTKPNAAAGSSASSSTINNNYLSTIPLIRAKSSGSVAPVFKLSHVRNEATTQKLLWLTDTRQGVPIKSRSQPDIRMLALNSSSESETSIESSHFSLITSKNNALKSEQTTCNVKWYTDTGNQDWNILPKEGDSVFTKVDGLNEIQVLVNGKLKRIRYDPKYNKKFEDMHIFFKFNLQSNLKDAIECSRMRLIQYTNFLTDCAQTKKEDSVEVQNYLRESSSITSLWYGQAARVMAQSRSSLFSVQALQSLLERKSSNALPLSNNKLLDNVDVVVLRPHSITKTGLQLALDEPHLNVLDYPVNTSIWNVKEDIAQTVFAQYYKSSNGYMRDSIANEIHIVRDEKELLKLDGTNIDNYLVNCMGRLSKSADQAIEVDNDDQYIKDNKFVETYFAESLTNYRRLELQTQYLLKNIDGNTFSEGEDSIMKKKKLLYDTERLEFRLPFAERSIPAILCPFFWSVLPHNKWRSMLNEIYNCLAPEGYILTFLYDLKLSSSQDSNSFTEFTTTAERNRMIEHFSLAALNKKFHMYPTKELLKTFGETGFENIKYTALEFKTGDLTNKLGYMQEFFAILNWHTLLTKVEGYEGEENQRKKQRDFVSIYEQYVREHIDKLDENAGSGRIIYIVAQKPL